MPIIAIDGACKRNGKPDCISLGCAYITMLDSSNHEYHIQYVLDTNSTNQRGELLAFIEALVAAKTFDEETYIVTDSEYIFNAVVKEWYKSWAKKGWVTADNNPIKNKDLWLKISGLLYEFEEIPVMYHIKGHVVSFGKATAAKLYEGDRSGETLGKAIADKFDSTITMDTAREYLDLFNKNHGFYPEWSTFKKFVVLNTVCDLLAVKRIEEIDAAANSK